jgi:hypothetical protein
MPSNWKNEISPERLARRTRLNMPVIGMESEFNVWLDEEEIIPEAYWTHPKNFIDAPLLKREKTSSHIPTGGAVYFDRGVIEVVTPVIELAPHSTARMVRSLWEQIEFVRDQLTRWEQETGHTVRLKAYSSHYNISYEMPRRLQNANRNEKKLALLLAHILPVPVMIAGANRRSTGVGVRPRGRRIEVTVDFTPDPALMIATATLIVGIVRAVMEWPSYDLSMLHKRPVPVIAGVIPGKHTTRKGWLTKDFHYPQSPYTSDINEPIWETQFGQMKSLRQIAKEVAWTFRTSIRRHSDPFSVRLLFAILDGRAPSLLDLADRPKAYEDVGRLCRWGMVIDELRNFGTPAPASPSILIERKGAADALFRQAAPAAPLPPKAKKEQAPLVAAPRRTRTPAPPVYLERRAISLLDKRRRDRRSKSDRRRNNFATPFPDRRLTRSAYEQVFLKLVSGGRLRVGRDLYTPVGMKGWYHAIFRNAAGEERMLTIDQLLRKMNDWT